MRDPARIEIMIKALHEAWLKEPDMRLGQLLVTNAWLDEPCPQLFYIEDDQLLKNLNEWNLKQKSEPNC